MPHTRPAKYGEMTPDRHHVQHFYRCNCTPCHKTGHLHVRLEFAPDDFMVLQPADPLTQMSSYSCNDGVARWLFCPTCGVQPFLIVGESEAAEVDLDALGVVGEDGEKLGKRTVWRPKNEGWGEGTGWNSYLSVNGYTIDAGQEGFDLRVLHEQNVIEYCDDLDWNGQHGQPRYDRPHVYGSY
jgi:hypothetical protein